MIETNVEVSKDLEQALKVLQQAKQRVANEKKITFIQPFLKDGTILKWLERLQAIDNMQKIRFQRVETMERDQAPVLSGYVSTNNRKLMQTSKIALGDRCVSACGKRICDFFIELSFFGVNIFISAFFSVLSNWEGICLAA